MFQPLFLQLDGNAGFDLIPVNLNHPKLGGSIISIYYSLLLGQLWTHLGFCGFKNRILRNDKMELRPPGCPFLSRGRRQQLLLDTHRSASPNISACIICSKNAASGIGTSKKKHPTCSKAVFFFQKRHRKKMDDGYLFHISEVSRILRIRFLGRSEVAKSNVLVKPPNCEHVKKSESHLRPQNGFLHDRSAAIARNSSKGPTPPNARFLQRSKASLRDS